VEVAEEFTPRGKKVVYTRGRDTRRRTAISTRPPIIPIATTRSSSS